MFETHVNGRKIKVKFLREVTIRTGAILKDRAVEYQSLHDGEVCVRRKAEFERMFSRCE